MPTHSLREVTLVNIDDPTDVAIWALVMKTTPEDVTKAAKEVGPDPEAIRKYLTGAEQLE